MHDCPELSNHFDQVSCSIAMPSINVHISVEKYYCVSIFSLSLYSDKSNRFSELRNSVGNMVVLLISPTVSMLSLWKVCKSPRILSTISSLSSSTILLLVARRILPLKSSASPMLTEIYLLRDFLVLW